MSPRPVREEPALGETLREITEVPDAALVSRLAEGELGALGALYDRHQSRVRAFLVRATGNGADVDDLVHETFLVAAKCAARYDGRAFCQASCRPWLVGISVQLLRRRRKAFGRLSAFLRSLGGVGPGPVDVRPSLQARSEVTRALARLSEAQRVTFLMAELEGFTCPEIAEALAIPVGTVWTRLHAARRSLRLALDEEGGRA